MKKIIISLGGSLFYPREIDADYGRKFAQLVQEISKKAKVAIVTGGGKLARNYIEVARKAGANDFFCDLLGIEASRMNARLLAALIGKKATSAPPWDFPSALQEFTSGKVVVMGGTTPGHSTDAVSALLAECLEADLLINMTDVDGLYDNDPQTHPQAKLYSRVSPQQLVDMVKNKSTSAGKYELLDILAAKIVQRSAIPLIILNGQKLPNLKRAVEGKNFTGTVVKK